MKLVVGKKVKYSYNFGIVFFKFYSGNFLYKFNIRVISNKFELVYFNFVVQFSIVFQKLM